MQVKKYFSVGLGCLARVGPRTLFLRKRFFFFFKNEPFYSAVSLQQNPYLFFFLMVQILCFAIYNGFYILSQILMCASAQSFRLICGNFEIAI